MNPILPLFFLSNAFCFFDVLRKRQRVTGDIFTEEGASMKEQERLQDPDD